MTPNERFDSLGEDRQIKLLRAAAYVLDFDPAHRAAVDEEAKALSGEGYQSAQDSADQQFGGDLGLDFYQEDEQDRVSTASIVAYLIVAVLFGTVTTVGLWLTTKSPFVLSGGLAASVVVPLGTGAIFSEGKMAGWWWWLVSRVRR